MSPLVEEEPSMHHDHMCTSCGFLFTFHSHVRDNMDDGLVTSELLSDAFDIDAHVTYNYNKLI